MDMVFLFDELLVIYSSCLTEYLPYGQTNRGRTRKFFIFLFFILYFYVSATNSISTMATPERISTEEKVSLENTDTEVVQGQDEIEKGESENEGTSLDAELTKLSLQEHHNDKVLICDAGYGFPSEARPRREKILAVAKQIFNFLQWQCQNDEKKKFASVQIVSKNMKDQEAVQSRLQELWGQDDSDNTKELPKHVEFICDASTGDSEENYILQQSGAVYLSPDATEVMSADGPPADVVIIGMLIDRRIQPNRSLNRSKKLSVKSERWPLEVLPTGVVHPQEPLNVDVILEGMQQWWWNADENASIKSNQAFVKAASQALIHHYKRHPNRPLHKIID